MHLFAKERKTLKTAVPSTELFILSSYCAAPRPSAFCFHSWKVSESAGRGDHGVWYPKYPQGPSICQY